MMRLQSRTYIEDFETRLQELRFRESIKKKGFEADFRESYTSEEVSKTRQQPMEDTMMLYRAQHTQSVQREEDSKRISVLAPNSLISDSIAGIRTRKLV